MAAYKIAQPGVTHAPLNFGEPAQGPANRQPTSAEPARVAGMAADTPMSSISTSGTAKPVRATSSDRGPDVCELMRTSSSKETLPGPSSVMDAPVTDTVAEATQSWEQGLAGSARPQEFRRPAEPKGGNVASDGLPEAFKTNLIGPGSSNRPGRQTPKLGDKNFTHATGLPAKRGRRG